MDEFLPKPVNQGKLREIVESFLSEESDSTKEEDEQKIV
jgi:FixJ family two-component response regulator